jgi:hypothetical protein
MEVDTPHKEEDVAERSPIYQPFSFIPPQFTPKLGANTFVLLTYYFL